MRIVKSTALASVLVAACQVTIGCSDDGEGSGGESGSTTATTVTATTGGPTTTTNVSSSSTGTGDGGGGGVPVDPCAPTDDIVIEPTCGIFVNASAAKGGDGSQATPFNTIADALAAANDRNFRIYVCGDITEAATVPAGRAIHGDLTCTGDWQWDLMQRTEWDASPGEVPLRTQGGATPTVITGFAIASRDAILPGISSIAVLAEGGTLDLARTSISAGNATGGELGEVGAAGVPGTMGGTGGVGYPETGGIGATSSCGGMQAGNGGFQDCIQGMNGNCVATPTTEATPSPGAGGTSGATTCTNGDAGIPGVPGMTGAGAVGIGSVNADGFVPIDGLAGTAGSVGGPGGGGGAKFTDQLWGGGGGSGGCGGGGSTGGRGGGASIAILSLNATLLFTEVTAAAGFGGNGGAGGAASPGGASGGGGAGGCTGLITLCALPGAGACEGGNGGVGGTGGPGGGGAGGHAVIIAYTGIQNPLDGLTAQPPTNQAGLGGDGTAIPGVAAIELEFP